ncbi:hypothetical protein [Microbacterium sp. 18062]|uniref:hypothetical protein n=1 Tax=Microbacterium sp. 18062 TaxID=2681410 RepID=UPI001358F93E|nr:hypothetical protein [Microbacterium sp. 18062]
MTDPLGKSDTPAYEQVAFANPVSLASATTVTEAGALQIKGYHFVSDSIIGDYWLEGGLSVNEFLSEVEQKTGTAPEVVAAYVDGEAYAQLEEKESARTSRLLGESLPFFDAPDGDPSRESFASTDAALQLNALAANETWQPNTAEAMITQMSSTNLAIEAKYSWCGLDPYASPTKMAKHWGMEFQFDFYTQMRPNNPTSPLPIGYGVRPHCGATTSLYKDWAAASTREYSWFAWVIAGSDQIYAPGNLGMYGDFNDLSDPCNVSTIAVGMAQPQVMPHSVAGTNHLSIYYYPLKGEDAYSVVGAIVQPVSRTWCEQNPSMPLMDCMGVAPGAYPGPGPTSSRMVLNNANGRAAPNLCWYSPDFGTTPAQFWACTSGDV